MVYVTIRNIDTREHWKRCLVQDWKAQRSAVRLPMVVMVFARWAQRQNEHSTIRSGETREPSHAGENRLIVIAYDIIIAHSDATCSLYCRNRHDSVVQSIAAIFVSVKTKVDFHVLDQPFWWPNYALEFRCFVANHVSHCNFRLYSPLWILSLCTYRLPHRKYNFRNTESPYNRKYDSIYTFIFIRKILQKNFILCQDGYIKWNLRTNRKESKR